MTEKDRYWDIPANDPKDGSEEKKDVSSSSEYVNNLSYQSFYSLLGVKEGTFFDYFKNKLPSYGRIKEKKTPKQRIFKQYFDIRSKNKITDAYSYAHLYSYQGKLLISPSYSGEREIFLKDIISFIFLSSNVSTLFVEQKLETNSEFSLKLDLAKVEHIPLSENNEWNQTQQRVLAYIIIQFFKDHSAAFQYFLLIYYRQNKEFIDDLLLQKKQESTQKKQKILKEKQESILNTITENSFLSSQEDEIENTSEYPHLTRYDELSFMRVNSAGDVLPPERGIFSQKMDPNIVEEEWRQKLGKNNNEEKE